MSPRRRQGAVLIVGAALLYLLVEIGGLRFYWTPLLVGLTYLGAAAVGGPRASYWATAAIITAWGLAVLALSEYSLRVPVEAGYLVGVGIGALVAAALERRGFAVGSLGIAGAILLAGAFYALTPRVDAFGRASTYAALLAVVGLVRLAGPERRGAGSARRRSR